MDGEAGPQSPAPGPMEPSPSSVPTTICVPPLPGALGVNLEMDLDKSEDSFSHLVEEREEDQNAMIIQENLQGPASNSNNSSDHEEEEEAMVMEGNDEDPASNSKNSSGVEEEEEEEVATVMESPVPEVPVHIKIIKKQGHVEYKCTICKKQFGTKSHCDYHMFCLTGEARFKCEFDGCGRGFMTKSHYNYHVKTHLRVGTRPKRKTPKRVFTGYKGTVSKKRGRSQKIQAPKIPARAKRALPKPAIRKPVSIQSENTRITRSRSFLVASSPIKTLDTAQIIPERVPPASVNQPPPPKSPVSVVNLKTSGPAFKEKLNKLMKTKGDKLDFKRKLKNGATIVHQAALVGHVAALEHFISLGNDVNARCNEGRTPLHYAVCQEENLEGTVSILVQNGGNINAIDKKGNNVLFAAISSGRNKKQLEYLVNRGSDWRAKNKLGYSVLHVAANSGNTEALNYFLLKKLDINCLSSIHGSTPLHQMAFARRNFSETLKILFDNRAEIGKVDKYGNNVLLLATLAGRPLKDLKLLVNYGCDWRARNRNGHGIIHLAAMSSKFPVLKHFISEGADVNSPDNHGRTPFHQLILSKKFSLEKLQLIWETGINIGAVDKQGMNVVHMAVISGKGRDVLASLVSRGADWKAKMKNGHGVLDLVAENGNEEAAKYFLSLEADVNATGGS